MQAPPDVEGLAGAYVAGGVELTWDAVAEGTGYTVYRRDGNRRGARFARLTPTPIAVTTYRDESVAEDKTYYYTITGKDLMGAESGPSPVATAILETETAAAAGAAATIIATASATDRGQQHLCSVLTPPS